MRTALLVLGLLQLLLCGLCLLCGRRLMDRALPSLERSELDAREAELDARDHGPLTEANWWIPCVPFLCAAFDRMDVDRATLALWIALLGAFGAAGLVTRREWGGIAAGLHGILPALLLTVHGLDLAVFPVDMLILCAFLLLDVTAFVIASILLSRTKRAPCTIIAAE